MPRFSLFLEAPAEISLARSTAAHFIPWVRYTGSAGFWTKRDRSKFTANVLDDHSRTLEIVRHTGSKLRVREWEWKGCMVDFLEMQRLDGIGYKRSSRVNRFLTPMLCEFFAHLLHEKCFCLQDTQTKCSPPKSKNHVTKVWES